MRTGRRSPPRPGKITIHYPDGSTEVVRPDHFKRPRRTLGDSKDTITLREAADFNDAVTVELKRPVPPDVGGVVEIRTAASRPPLCLARVDDTWPVDGGHAVLLTVVHLPHVPRLLAARPHSTNLEDKHIELGYTSQSALALTQSDEAPEREWQELHSEERSEIDSQRRLADRVHRSRREPLGGRVAAALEQAKRAGVDVSRQEAAILRRVEAIENKTRKTKAA